MIKHIITWDLGATKCAAALVVYHTGTQQFNCLKQTSLKIREYASLEQLASAIEESLQIRMQDADSICIGAAGQYDGEYLLLDKDNKGYPYLMPFAAIAAKNHWPTFAIVHDYSPVVCATFTAYMQDANNIKYLNAAPMPPQGRRVALGIGTGVGMKDGVLFTNGDFWLGTNEAGHIGVSTPPLANKMQRERHRDFLHFLHQEQLLREEEALTFENILAGPGLARIHAFFDRQAKHKTSEEIGELVRLGKAPETLGMFAWYLGLLVGTIQLAFMPEGGVWLTGGVVLNHLEIFEHPEFFAGIESSPAYLTLRKTFPLGILHGTEHAFLGAAYYASKRLL